MPANLENSAVATDWKRSVFIPIPKKSNAKECSNYHRTELISQASKVMLKILQARLQQYMNCELPDVQAGFRKCRRTRDQIANMLWVGTPLSLVQWKRASSLVEAGTSGFLSISDSDRRVPEELGQEGKASSCVKECNFTCLSSCSRGDSPHLEL